MSQTPRNRGSQSADQPRQPKLAVSLAEAQKAIEERIRMSEQLADELETASTNDALDHWRKNFQIWDDYNRAWLASVDKSGVLAHEYSSPVPLFISLGGQDSLPQRKARDGQTLRRKQQRLQSIANRLPLYGADLPVETGGDSSEEANAPPRVLIVHGHDTAIREAVARTIEHANLVAVLLREQPNAGRTMLEKLLDHAEAVRYGVVILTGDDRGGPKEDPNQQPRARQNVIFEFGLLVGLLGRRNVCVLYEPGVELPSDVLGITYVELDKAEGWRSQLVSELAAAGLPVRQ